MLNIVQIESLGYACLYVSAFYVILVWVCGTLPSAIHFKVLSILVIITCFIQVFVKHQIKTFKDKQVNDIIENIKHK